MIFIFSGRPPEPIDEDMRPAIEDDREWFRLHPDSNIRVRPRIPGEFGPLDDLYVHAEFTIITRQPDGSRHRRPLLPMSGEAGDHGRV